MASSHLTWRWTCRDTIRFFQIGRNQAWFDSMEKEIYIEETLHIMKDLVAMTHKS
jgi:hypothetical protein